MENLKEVLPQRMHLFQSTRQSGFNPEWGCDFPFVIYSEDQSDEAGMFCSLCQKWNKVACNRTGVWITKPCTSLRRDSILDHSRSKGHNDAIRAEKDAVQAKLRGGIVQAFTNVQSAQKKAVIGALKCMYWLAKQEIAHTTNFESLLNLAVSLGSAYLKDLHQGGNAKYTSHESMFEFVKVLSSCIEQDVLSEIHQAKYVGLLCDETTDVSITKQLIIYCRYVMAGEVNMRYLKIKDLPNGTAETVENALVSACQEADIPLTKVMGFGSDGASVMVGSKTGRSCSATKKTQPSNDTYLYTVLPIV